MSVIFADGRTGRRVQLVVKVASPWPYSAGVVQSRWVVQSGLHGYDFVVFVESLDGVGPVLAYAVAVISAALSVAVGAPGLDVAIRTQGQRGPDACADLAETDTGGRGRGKCHPGAS